MNMLMKIISGLLIIGGIALQILVPANLIEVTGLSLFGLPSQIFSVLLGVALFSCGMAGAYLFHYRAYAQKLGQGISKK